MTNSLGPSLELEFQNRLLAAVTEVSRHTRLGLTTIQADIQSIGGLKAAKKRLSAGVNWGSQRGFRMRDHSGIGGCIIQSKTPTCASPGQDTYKRVFEMQEPIPRLGQRF